MLPTKNITKNSSMFRIIKETALRNDLEFNNLEFQIDFEIGIIVSIEETFGHETVIKHRLFHFGQYIWRYVQNLGLVNDYIHSDKVKKNVQQIFSLALVPIDRIDDCWTEIHSETFYEIFLKHN